MSSCAYPASASSQSPAGDEFDVGATPVEPGSTLIEASAGTGKTFTLAGLYLRLLVQHQLKVEQILVVTYTVAATSELRDRIRRNLAQARTAFAAAAAGRPLPPDSPPYLAVLIRSEAARWPVVLRDLEAALAGFDQAAIHTIHGFCQRALRDRAFESGSLFDVELVTDLSDLQARAAEDFWRREVLAAGAVPLALAIGEFTTPTGLLHELAPLLHHAQLTTLPADGPPLQAAASAVQAAHEALRAHWQAHAERLRQCFGSGIKWGNDPYNSDAKMQAAFASVAAALTHPAPSFEALGSLRLFTTAALAEKRSKRSREVPPQLPFIALCDAFAVAADHWQIVLQQAALASLRRALPQLKARLKIQSFDDLLTRLHDALSGPAGDGLAGALRAQYRAALIDEFQDTDPLQFRIFQRVFQAPAADGGLPFLFLIGDPKQAIYGFRGADLETYLHARRSVARRFTLRRNFRSAPRLVEGVNHIFQQNAGAFLSPDIPFVPARAARTEGVDHFTGVGQCPTPLQVWLQPRGAKDVTAGQATRELPAAVATEIVRLLNSAARLGDRPLQPEDIAVLVPANHQATRIQEALGARGVPTVLQTTASLFSAEEVGEMRRLLSALDAPGDEALLKSALTTTALGLDAAELQAAVAKDIVWQDRSEGLADLSRLWARKGFLPMIRALLQREAVRARLLALPDGERRLTNLLHLAEVLHEAALEHNLSRAGLLNWLDEQAADPKAAGDAFQLRLERDERAVRLATIHRSKGLEYGIVFCPFSWKGVRNKRRKVEPLFHRTAAGGAPELVFDFGSPTLDANRAAAEQEKLAEQIRLLYVALTRAQHRCCLVWGRFNGAGTAAAAWLLHPPPGNGAPLERLEANWAELTNEHLQADLAALARRASGAVEIVPVPAATEARYQPPPELNPPAAARVFTAEIERGWRISSFSSLTAAHGHEQPDYDGQAPATNRDEPASGIFAFPRGARAGTCLHKIFESLEFTRFTEPAARETVTRSLREHGLGTHWAGELERMIAQVLQAPLPGARPFTLAGVPRAARLSEMEFCFPVGRLDPRQLNAFFAQPAAEAEEAARFAFEPVTGLIKGFIDLIFEVQGRYYLVDWKSNWLGSHPHDYSPALLGDEIRRRGYDLQYRIYTVALDRYLRGRLQHYDYEAHFGGVFYLFLRGVDAAHPGCGIYHDRPAAGFVREFAALLEATGSC
jgi:exodeoxyribonuclease V beta subunit